MNATWSPDELSTIGAAGEIDVAPQRSDGSVGRATTIWVVRVDDDLYVRSYRGPGGTWYHSARRTHAGRLRANGAERDITFDEAPDADGSAIDDGYAAKYGRSSYVDAMVTPAAAATTMRLLPR